ncbi:MAG TPA: hypothetical protein DCM54_00290 [Gammaproteobacteria bacterium]|nr:hypothetical protein [Gammaproteobacteria bacterium]
MPELLSKETILVRDSAEAFVNDVLLPLEAELEDDSVPDEVKNKVRSASQQAGFYYKTQPTEFGGKPAGVLELTMLRELWAQANSPLTNYIFGPGPGILHAAQGELKDNYLDPVMRGEKRGAFGFTEPDTAKRPSWARIDGDTLIINGQKSYVTGGATADFVSALINVENEGGSKAGTAMVVIDREADGVTIEREFASMEGGGHVSMTFHDVRVPISRVIGKIGEGMPRAMSNIGEERLQISAGACGMGIWTIKHITDRLNAAHRSGTRLSDREGVRLRYSDMRIDLYAARSALYRTARLAEAGEDIVNEAAATKVLCTEMIGRVVDTAVQLAGGQALIEGEALEQMYRRVRSLRFAGGASDILRLSIARGIFDFDSGRV